MRRSRCCRNPRCVLRGWWRPFSGSARYGRSAAADQIRESAGNHRCNWASTHPNSAILTYFNRGLWPDAHRSRKITAYTPILPEGGRLVSRVFARLSARCLSRGRLPACALGLLALVTLPTIGEAKPAPDSFADLAAKLLPAVVNISSTQEVQARAGVPGGPEMPLFPPGSPFEQFFKDFLNRNRPGQGQQHGDAAPAPERRMQSLGSGFNIDPSGLVVTNNHVIEGADQITVTLQDNTSLKAKVLGRDETGDVALLQVKTDKPLPA